MVLQYITELDDPLSAILEVSERDDGTAIYLDLHLCKMYRRFGLMLLWNHFISWD